ncbi:hypothetical protein [Dinoroseobacter sp. S124A]|uniref:hypothetical protein n=1 Tax=Dinoroseobacter sp. S124A TaxID=3415128 RepID=UPI003C7C8FE2
MIRPLLRLLARSGCAAFCASAALAGPWPQEDGRLFVTAAQETAGEEEDWVATLYAEYGLTENLTLGFDGSANAFVAEGYAFARYPVFQNDGPHRFAILGGVGASGNLVRPPKPLWVIGASWGRGLSYPFGNGWTAVDASARFRHKDSFGSRRLIKVDATIGWQRENKHLVYLQLQTSQEYDQDPLAKLVPTYVWHFSDLFQVETAVTLPILGDEDPRVKFGVWSRF